MIAAGTKIEWADMEAFAVIARQKLPTRATHFFGARHVIDHAVDAPTVAGWLGTNPATNDYFLHGLLIGDIVINTRFPRPTQSVGGWRLTGYPWNDPAKWVRANIFIGTQAQWLAVANPGFRSIWYLTDATPPIYVRQLTAWEVYEGWARELERLQNALAVNQRFNFYDSPAQFLGWSKSALVSERRLCQSPWITSGDQGRFFRRSDYNDLENGARGKDIFPITLDNNEDAPAPTIALEHEILHYGGNGADWKLEMVPQLSHLQGLSGFRLVGRGGYVRGRLTNMPLRGLPGSAFLTPGTTLGTVTLQGSMASIASYYAAIRDFGGGQRVLDFHILIDGTMGPGNCTIGADITLEGGSFRLDSQPTQQYLPMVGSSGSVVFPLWVDVDLPNSSTPAPGFSIDGQPIYTSGILPDDTFCQYLAGYQPAAPRAKNTERCDRFTYYATDGAVRQLSGVDSLFGIGKSVPCGISGDMTDDVNGSVFAPGYYFNSAEPTLENAETVDVAVNRRGDRPGNNSALCKTIPFVKHAAGAATAPFTDTRRQFALVEVTVQRQPVLSGRYHVMPTLPDHPTPALQVKVGYYVDGADGNFVHAGITIDLPENVNVIKWRGLLFIKSDRGLVYQCTETVNITGLVSVFDGTEIISAGALPARWNYLIETQRLLQAL